MITIILTINKTLFLFASRRKNYHNIVVTYGEDKIMIDVTRRNCDKGKILIDIKLSRLRHKIEEKELIRTALTLRSLCILLKDHADVVQGEDSISTEF